MGLFSKLKKAFKPLEKALKAPVKAFLSAVPGGPTILAGHKGLTSVKKKMGFSFSGMLDRSIGGVVTSGKGALMGVVGAAVDQFRNAGGAGSASELDPQMSQEMSLASAGFGAPGTCIGGQSLLQMLLAEPSPMTLAAAESVQGSIDLGTPTRVCIDASGQMVVSS